MPGESNPAAAGESDRGHIGRGATWEMGQVKRAAELPENRGQAGSAGKNAGGPYPLVTGGTGARLLQTGAADGKEVRFPQRTDKAPPKKCKNPGHCHKDRTIPSLSL